VADRAVGGLGPAAPQGHLEGVDDELGTDVVGDGPADDPAGPGVEDDGDVHLAAVGGVLGDVSDPQLVGPVHGELAVHQIVAGLGIGVAARASLAALVDPHDAVEAHQPLDAFAATADPFAQHQLVMDPRAAIGAAGQLVDGPDLVDQRGVGHGSR